ncbi:MAG: DHH family phosphoesterase [Oscillospiraceae bacterium]|nr:DHH family phosphoesterase [Oscillospiraceae bacterium]
MGSCNVLKAARLLKEQDCFLLITHKNPDGDTLCSAAALCHALRRAGKSAFLYRNEQITEKFQPYVGKYLAEDGFVPKFVVSVDLATEQLFPHGFQGRVDFCVDHHPTNSFYAAETLVDPERSSCGEIVISLIEKLCGNLAKEEADLLYIAVSTDTGCFQYANTNAKTFSAASHLLAHGADNASANLVFFRQVSCARIQLEGMIYSGMTFHCDNRVVVATVTQEMMRACSATEDDCDDLASLTGRVKGGKVGITIREMANGESKISVRTSKDVSAIAICRVFGGGGHEMAAGCTIPTGPARAKELLLAVVDEVMK